MCVGNCLWTRVIEKQSQTAIIDIFLLSATALYRCLFNDCRARTRCPWWNSRAFFLQNVLHLLQHRWIILRVDNLAIWKIINEEDTILIPKNRGQKFSSRFLHSEFFRAGLYWLLLCLQVIVTYPSFVHAHPSRPTGNHFDRAEKIQNLFRRMAPLKFLFRVQAFRDPFRGELPHVQIFMNDRHNPFTWDAQLLSYWFSRNPAVFLF